MARNLIGTSPGLLINGEDVLKGKSVKHGFPVPYEVSLSYNKTTRTITLTPTGTSFSIWIKGREIKKTGAQTSPAHNNVSGSYFFTYDSSGNLQVSSSPWDILGDMIPVCFVYYSQTLTDGIPLFELHSADRNLHTHQLLHFTVGTTIKSTNDFLLGNYTLDTSTSAGVCFSVSAGSIFDEDILFNIDALPVNRAIYYII